MFHYIHRLCHVVLDTGPGQWTRGAHRVRPRRRRGCRHSHGEARYDVLPNHGGIDTPGIHQPCFILFDYLGMPYLDVIYRLRQSSNLPIAAYHVSGEYAMLKAAAQKVRYKIKYLASWAPTIHAHGYY